MSTTTAADVADELFVRACHAEYGPSRPMNEPRKKRGRRDRIRQSRRSGGLHQHATNNLLHAVLPRFRSSRRQHHRLRRQLMVKAAKLGISESDGVALKPEEIREERQKKKNVELDPADLVHLDPFQRVEIYEEGNELPQSRRASASSTTSFGARRVSHGKLVRPAPAAIGIAKLKDHDGPDEPAVENVYHKGITSFPDLNPAPVEADKSVTPTTESLRKTIALTITPRDVYYCSPRDVQLRAQLHRELITWYFYSRSTSSALQGGEERAIASGHPIKMCSMNAQVQRMPPLIEEEGENNEGFDVFAGIGTKGFTFALSKVDRRSLTAAPSQPQNGPPVHSSATVNAFRGPYKHRMRRVSLTTDLQISDSGKPVVANFGLVKSSAAPLVKPRERRRNLGPHKFGRSWGTSLGPWVDHDPDLCDRHNHSRYLTNVAGSVKAYLEEQASGWTSHSQLQFAWQDVPAAEGGVVEHVNQPNSKDFTKLFDKLLDDGINEKPGKREKQHVQNSGTAGIMSTVFGFV